MHPSLGYSHPGSTCLSSCLRRNRFPGSFGFLLLKSVEHRLVLGRNIQSSGGSSLENISLQDIVLLQQPGKTRFCVNVGAVVRRPQLVPERLRGIRVALCGIPPQKRSTCFLPSLASPTKFLGEIQPNSGKSGPAGWFGELTALSNIGIFQAESMTTRLPCSYQASSFARAFVVVA